MARDVGAACRAESPTVCPLKCRTHCGRVGLHLTREPTPPVARKMRGASVTNPVRNRPSGSEAPPHRSRCASPQTSGTPRAGGHGGQGASNQPTLAGHGEPLGLTLHVGRHTEDRVFGLVDTRHRVGLWTAFRCRFRAVFWGTAFQLETARLGHAGCREHCPLLDVSRTDTHSCFRWLDRADPSCAESSTLVGP